MLGESGLYRDPSGTVVIPLCFNLSTVAGDMGGTVTRVERVGSGVPGDPLSALGGCVPRDGNTAIEDEGPVARPWPYVLTREISELLFSPARGVPREVRTPATWVTVARGDVVSVKFSAYTAMKWDYGILAGVMAPGGADRVL